MKLMFTTLAPFSSFPSYKRATGMGAGLVRLGHEVFIAIEDCEENRRRFPVEAPGCVPIWIDGRNVLREVWEKLRAVWQIRPDFVYLVSYSPRNLAFFRMFFPSCTKMIVEFCELYSAWGEHPFRWKIKEFVALLEASRILCASQYLKRVFEGRVRLLRLNKPVLYSPYAYPEYLVPQERTDRVHRRIVVMMSIGVAYGCLRFLQAMKDLLPRFPNLVVDQIGGGDVDAARKWVRENGCEDRLLIHGFVDENTLNGYFSNADVFFAPLHNTVQDWARCPSKIFYYLPYGKPIVTCRIGDPIDVLGDDYPYYYQCEDMADLTRVLAKALDDAATFVSPKSLIDSHSWFERAQDFAEWIGKGC